jgi:hypothetical protein
VQLLKKEKFSVRSKLNFKILLGIALFGGIFAQANASKKLPHFVGKLEGDNVRAVYSNDKVATFSKEENTKLLTKILSQLPMAQSVTIVASDKPMVLTEIDRSQSHGYMERKVKQQHVVSVAFSRNDYLPVVHFDVVELWKDCEPAGEICRENVEFNITGPSRVVRDLNDFSSFPKVTNAFNMTVKVENLLAYNLDDPRSSVDWTFEFKNFDAVDQYLRYLRGKVSNHNNDEDRVSVKNLQTAMAMWASRVSRAVF